MITKRPSFLRATTATFLFGWGALPATGNAQTVPDAWAMVCDNFDYGSSQYYFTDVFWIEKDERKTRQGRDFADPLFRNFVAAQGQDPRYAQCYSFQTAEEAAQKIKRDSELNATKYPIRSLGAWHPAKPYSGTIAKPSDEAKQPADQGKRDSIIVRQPDQAPVKPIAQPAPKPVAKAKPVAKPVPKKPLTQCGGKGQRRCKVKPM